MTLESVGYGAGGRDLPIPNLLRVLIGEIPAVIPGNREQLALLETNLDDLNPEIYPYVVESLFAAGALDVIMVPIQMKKNRPGTQIQVLTEITCIEVIRSILFKETTTLGIRQTLVDRYSLPRTTQVVNTPFGKVTVKIAETSDGFRKISPEFEDCLKIARKYNLPVQQIYQDTICQFQSDNTKKK